MCSKLNCTERYEFQTLNILSKKISVTSFANSESSRINTSHSTTLQEFVSIFRFFQDVFELWRFPTTFRHSAPPAYSAQTNPSLIRDESIFNDQRIGSVSSLRICSVSVSQCFIHEHKFPWMCVDQDRPGRGENSRILKKK